MSDWKSRSQPADKNPEGNWKSRSSAVEEEIPAWQAGLTGAASGLTGRFSDEAYGLGRAGLDVMSGKSFEEAPDLYRNHRDEARAFQEKAQKAHPKLYMGSEIAGGVGSAFIPGLNASTIPRAMALGGAYGLGSSNADLTKGEYEDAAVDTAKGALTGGILKKAGEVIPATGRSIYGLIKKVPKEVVSAGASMLGIPGAGTAVNMANKAMQSRSTNGVVENIAPELEDHLKDIVGSSGLQNKALEASNSYLSKPEVQDLLKKAADKGPQYHALLLRLLSKSNSQP